MGLRTTCSVAVAAVVLGGCSTTVLLHEKTPVTVTAEAPEPPKEPAPVQEAARVEVKEDKIEVNEKIHFELDSAEIKADSNDLLSEIASVINDHPEIKKIRVEGHTDNQGAADYNQTLSENRAQAVVEWLVSQGGVDEARLISKGYGLEEPIADNSTMAGRAENRRVEFEILEREGQ